MAGDDLPEPLVPSDVDLRDYDYMPLYGDRLFGSDTWALCDADEKIAALSLWWCAWHEEPCGSLPNNDRLLSARAGYGVAVKAFLVVKANAMRGWILCADGRLYHPVVASIALDVWATKRRKRHDNEADRERKRLKRAALSGGHQHDFRRTDAEIPPDANPDIAKNPPDVRPENPLKGKGSEGKGYSSPYVSPPSGIPADNKPGRKQRGTAIPEDWKPRDEDLAWALAEHGVSPQRAEQITLEFVDFWLAASGSKAVHACWWRTWRNRIRQLAEQNRLNPNPNGANGDGRISAVDNLRLGAARAVAAIIERDRLAADRDLDNPTDVPLLDGQ
jgi:hypothetical protein